MAAASVSRASAISEWAAGVGRRPGPLEQVRPVGRVVRDLERLEEEDARLVVAAELGGTFCRSAQGQPRLGRERLTLRIVGRGAIGGEIVRGERAGQLVLAEPLEEPCRGKVAVAPICARRGVPYATSRTSDCTNAYWPRSGDRGSTSWTSSSRRTSARRLASRLSASRPLTAPRPASVKL